MKFDFSKLRGRIVEKFGTCAAFAAAAGFTEPTLSAKLNNKSMFTMVEIHTIIQPELLDIPADEIGVYFFTPEVR